MPQDELTLGREIVGRILQATRARRRQQKTTTTISTSSSSGTPPGEDPRVVRVCFYARYSSHMQDDGFSIEAQHEACEREMRQLREHGNVRWQVTYYDEPGRSAMEEKLDRRTRFLEAVADCIDGKFDVFAVHRLNRFARALKVQLLVLDELQRAGVGFASLYERIDFTTPSGRLMMQQLGAFAEFESREKADRVREAKRARARRGLHATHAPFGYRIDPETRLAVPDDRTERDADGRILGDWEGLQQFLRLLAMGLSDNEVADRMNADGRWRLSSPTRLKGADGTADRARLFTRTSVSEIRRNVFYRPYRPGDERGTVLHDGREYRGLHQAACSWDDWHALQAIARNRRRGWSAEGGRLGIPYTAEFRQLAACAGCGRALYVHRTVARKPTRTTPDQVYTYEKYVCASGQSKLTCASAGHFAFVEDVRAEWIRWAAAHLRLPADWEAQVEAYTTRLARTAGDGDGTLGDDPERVSARLRREIRAWNEKRRRATTAYLDGLIDEREMRERVAEAEHEVAAAEARLRGAAGHAVHLLDAGRLLTQIAELWPEMTTDERIRVAGRLVEPRGLSVRLLGHGRANARTRWDVARGTPRRPSCELVQVRLRPNYQELLVAVEAAAERGA